MSWWSALGKIAGIAGAPFTGGASLIPTLVSTGLDVAGAIGKGRAAGRETENARNMDVDRARTYMAGHNASMPRFRAQDAVRGDAMAGLQPLTLSGSGRNLSASGGMSPALLSQGSRQMGRQMNRQALSSAMGRGGSQDPYAMLSPTPMKQPGALDKILGGAGLAGGVLEAARGRAKSSPIIPLMGTGPDFGPFNPDDDIYAGMY